MSTTASSRALRCISRRQCSSDARRFETYVALAPVLRFLISARPPRITPSPPTTNATIASALLLSSSESDVVAAASSESLRCRRVGVAVVVLVAGRCDEGKDGHRVLGLLAAAPESLRSSGRSHRRRRSGSRGTRSGRRRPGAVPPTPRTPGTHRARSRRRTTSPCSTTSEISPPSASTGSSSVRVSMFAVQPGHRLHRHVRDHRVLGHVDLDAGRARRVTLVRHAERELGEAPLWRLARIHGHMGRCRCRQHQHRSRGHQAPNDSSHAHERSFPLNLLRSWSSRRSTAPEFPSFHNNSNITCAGFGPPSDQNSHITCASCDGPSASDRVGGAEVGDEGRRGRGRRGSGWCRSEPRRRPRLRRTSSRGAA